MKIPYNLPTSATAVLVLSLSSLTIFLCHSYSEESRRQVLSLSRSFSCSSSIFSHFFTTLILEYTHAFLPFTQADDDEDDDEEGEEGEEDDDEDEE